MVPLPNNAENVQDGLGRRGERSDHRYLCLLFAVALLCLNPALSAQELTTNYPLVTPKFAVLGWLYAPLGGGPSGGITNFVSYSQSSSVGSSHSQSFTSSNAQTQTNTTTEGFSLWGFGSQTQNTVSDQWTTETQSSSSVSITSVNSNSLEVTGAGTFDGANHDYDLAVLWLNPVMNTTLTYNPATTPVFLFNWQGLEYNGCELGNPSDPLNFYQLISGCDPLQGFQPDIVYVPALCLKSPYSQATIPMTPNTCVQWWQAQKANQRLYLSRYWDNSAWGVDPKTQIANGPGLTVQDFAAILRTNPFLTETLVADNYQKDGTGKLENPYTSPCHPTYGLDFNPDELETIPDSSTFSAPYSGTWPADFCGTAGTMMARMDQQKAVVHYQSSVDNGGGTQRSVQSTFANSATNTYVHSISKTITSSFDFSASIGLPLSEGISLSSSLFSDAFNFSTSSGTGSSSTDVQSWSNTNTTGSSSNASWQIIGPSPADNYIGPTTFNVYADNVYGTFAFWPPLTIQNPPTLPTSSPITVKMAAAGTVTCGSATLCNFGQVTVGKLSGAIPVTLTNASPYQLTMQSPSLSFSDLAEDASSNYAQVSSFEIVPLSDLCAGKVLAPGQSCTVRMRFHPRLVNAPNTQKATYPVNAYLVATGTEGIPFFSAGTCQTSYCSSVLVTNTVLRVTAPGAESFTRVTGTALPAAATCSGIKPSCNIGAALTPPTFDFPDNATSGTQVYTFKNWASKSATVSGVQLTDTTNFSITSDTCTGATVLSLKTCKFTLVYAAHGTGAFTAKVSVLGNLNVSGCTDPACTITASAGAAALIPQPVASLSPNPLNFGTLSSPNGVTKTATLTNTGAGTLNITTIGQPAQPFALAGTTCGSTLAPGASCTINVEFDPSGLANGHYTGTLSVYDNANDSPQSVPLEATLNCGRACQ